MSDYPVVRAAQPGDSHLRLRLVALTAVVIGVMLVALAAFLFSYTGIHHIALQAGVAPGLARLYPLMFDAMLIVTCSAVLATRAAGWGTKSYVWVCLLLVVGAVAVGDALYATGVHLTVITGFPRMLVPGGHGKQCLRRGPYRTTLCPRACRLPHQQSVMPEEAS